MSRNGFTLVEMMISMFILLLVIFAVISTYSSGIILMKKSGRHLQAQQEAIVTMNQIGNSVRESIGSDVYNFTPPLTWSSSPSGNFLVVYNPYGVTSAFYYNDNNMYCVPDFSQGTFNTSSNICIAKNIRNSTSFLKDSGSIWFDFEIRDNDDTNISLFNSTTWFTPRN